MQFSDDSLDPNDDIVDENEDEMAGFHLADDDEEKSDKDNGGDENELAE